MTSDLSKEFMKLCRNLVQGLEVSSPRELVQIAIIGVDTHELDVVKTTLKDLLSGRYTDDELMRLWWSTPSDIVFYEGKDVVTFLKLLQSEIDSEAQTDRSRA